MPDTEHPVTAADLEEAARQLAQRLADTRTRIVFAESCTGGLVAATLTAIPGISQWFCGSTVTYRDRTKVDWLGVSGALLDCRTAVDREVARAMAEGALQGTREAALAVSVTGHLGPDAPAELDGLVWLAVARRRDGRIGGLEAVQHRLASQPRAGRQREAALLVLRAATAALRGGAADCCC